MLTLAFYGTDTLMVYLWKIQVISSFSCVCFPLLPDFLLIITVCTVTAKLMRSHFNLGFSKFLVTGKRVLRSSRLWKIKSWIQVPASRATLGWQQSSVQHNFASHAGDYNCRVVKAHIITASEPVFSSPHGFS